MRKRVAAQNPPQGECTALKWPILLNSFNRIIGARRNVGAFIALIGGNVFLIKMNTGNHDFAHDNFSESLKTDEESIS